MVVFAIAAAMLAVAADASLSALVTGGLSGLAKKRLASVETGSFKARRLSMRVAI